MIDFLICLAHFPFCFWLSYIMVDHEVIKHTLRVYPKAASIPDSSGNLPLHLSLRAGKTWYTGVKEIFEAAPYAIHVQDRISHQFPFMITASKPVSYTHLTLPTI